MSTAISQVNTGNQIEHGVLIEMTLDGIEYYISNCYKTIPNPAFPDDPDKAFVALAGFLSVSEIQSNITNANDEIQVSLSAIPSDYIAALIGEPIKGGEISIYRAFFDYQTQEIITGAVYQRFNGVISNFSVQEDISVDGSSPEVSHTITIIASSIMGVLENKISGRRTNRQDYQIVYAELNNLSTDPSMDRVEELFNASFDFGKPYKPQAASSVNGSQQPAQQPEDMSGFG